MGTYRAQVRHTTCLVLGIWEQAQGQAHSVSGPEYQWFRSRHMQCLGLYMGWVPSHGAGAQSPGHPRGWPPVTGQA